MAKKTTVAARRRRRNPAATPGPKPDALEILVREHRRFKALLAQGEATTERAGKGRRRLLDSLVSELAAHEVMEEQVLYPALLSYAHTRETLSEGLDEHDGTDAIVNELRAVSPHDPEWSVRFRVLKEYLENHMDHEEKHLFPVARGVFPRQELRDLADQMLALKPPPPRRRGRG